MNKDWIMELCPEIAEWQAEIIAEQVRIRVKSEREAIIDIAVQEPVAWRFQSALGGWAYGSQPPLGSKYPVYPLYSAPPQRKPLSGIQVERLLEQVIGSLPVARKLIRAVEAAHGIKE